MKTPKVNPEINEGKVKIRCILVEYKDYIKNQCQIADWPMFLWNNKLLTTGVYRQ